MSDDKMRDRLILPILIPVGALAFVLFLALVMSQILLNVPAEIATSVAIMTAINLLVAFSVMAAKPSAGKPLAMFLGIIAVVPLVLGGAAAAGVVSFPEEEGHGEEAVTVDLVADSLAFEQTELSIPADKEFIIAFDNKEAQPHNVSILEAAGSTNALFRGAIITGPKEVEEKVDPIAAGEYYFQCDVHPTMNGKVIAAEGESSGGEVPAGEH